MQQIISDIRQYIKQTYSDGSMIYSSHAPLFEGIAKPKKKKAIKKSTPPKIKTAAPKPEPKKEAKKESEDARKQLVIQKMKAPKRAPGNDFRSFYGNYSPQFNVHDKPKDDAVAKKVKAKSLDQKVLSDVVIFTDSSMTPFNRLLGNIAHAIEIKLCPCRLLDISVIEKSNRWENIFSSHKLHLIMIPESVLKRSTNLVSYYKDGKIGGVDTFFLSDLDEVQKNPEKKKALWKAITDAASV